MTLALPARRIFVEGLVKWISKVHGVDTEKDSELLTTCIDPVDML